MKVEFTQAGRVEVPDGYSVAGTIAGPVSPAALVGATVVLYVCEGCWALTPHPLLHQKAAHEGDRDG